MVLMHQGLKYCVLLQDNKNFGQRLYYEKKYLLWIIELLYDQENNNIQRFQMTKLTIKDHLFRIIKMTERLIVCQLNSFCLSAWIQVDQIQAYVFCLKIQQYFLFIKYFAESMYGHPQQGNPGQPTRYSSSAQQHQANFSAYANPHQYNAQPPYQQPTTHSHVQQYQMAGHQMLNQNPTRSAHQPVGYGQQQFVNQNAALIQPPALNVEENMDTNSQFFPPRPPMTMSNNQHSEFDGYHNQQEDPMWANQAQIASMFWQQRCMTMLERFEWLYDRFEMIRNEYVSLSDEMQKMDSEEEWHNFQQHHDQFHQKIMEMEQELSAVLGENEQLLQQKRAPDGQSMWEQRYQELLGNFKSLQEEMTHMEPSGGASVPLDQYHQLEEHYGELEYQYGEVVKELQLHRDDMQNGQHLQEIQSYKMKQNQLHNENVELQNMILELEEKNSQYKEAFKTVVDKSKFQQLAALIQQKELQIQKLQQDFKTRSANQSAVSQYQSALASKNKEVEQLKQLNSDMERQIREQRSKLELLEGTLKNKIRSEYENEKFLKDKKIAQLQLSIENLKRDSHRSTENTIKLQNIQKKLLYSNQQVASLNETLKKKNQQLIQLRTLTYQIDKLKDIQSSYNRAIEQRDKFSESLKKKNVQIEAMHQEVQKLTVKIQEVTNKRQEYSTRNLMAQIQDLSEQIRRYEGEITKLKNIIQLKEQYTQRLQQDLKSTNDKYIATQQTLIIQRDNWKEKQLKLTSKSFEHQNRIKKLDYEFNMQLKQTLEKEVGSLRKQNIQKQQFIRSMEEKELLLSSQLAVFQKQKNNYDKDISLLRRKQKELQNLNQALTRRFRELEAAYLAKESDLQLVKINHISLNNQVNSLKMQIQENNNLIKAKNRTIEDFQKQINQHLGRSQQIDNLSNENGRLKIALNAAQEELSSLKFHAQSRLGNSKVLSHSGSRKQFDRQESNLVNHLQQQNQYLKAQVSKMLQKLHFTKVVSKQLLQSPSQPKLIAVDLNRRLNEFNSKLHNAIGGNESKTLSHSRSQNLAPMRQEDKRQLVQNYENQIKELKRQLKEVRVPVNTQKTQQSILVESPRKNAYSRLEDQQNRDQLLFFKQKYNEQQERNQTLVKVNEELRQRIENVLKLKQNTNTNDYFKEQNKQLSSQIDTLKSKIKKVTEENKQFRIQLGSKNSKLSQEYELKILEFELLVQEQKRKISYLNAQKASASNEKANLLHNNNIKNLDIQPKNQTYKHAKYSSLVPQSRNIQQKYQTHKYDKYYNYIPSSHNVQQNIQPYKRGKNANYTPQSYNIQQKGQTYKNDKYASYLPQSPKPSNNIEQQFQSVLGNLRGNPPQSNIYRQINTSQISSHTYGDSRIDHAKSRLQKV